MSYKVRLQSFEGPFNLLVYLIENAEMSIYDIRISEITTQYLNYLRTMEENDIAVTEEFMTLAASLIEIKSRMILPRTDEVTGAVIEEDPRNELVERLLEYKRFRNASDMLKEREDHSQRIFEKPQEDISIYTDNPDEYLSLDIRQFASAFSLFIEKKQKVEAVRRHYTRVERERTTMENRINLIVGRLKEKAGKIFSFREFVQNKKDRYDVVVTFVSLLEMAKERVVSINQRSTYGDIEVTAGENLNEEKKWQQERQ